MLEKLSPISLKCFDAAKQEARRLKSADLNPRHLILGLLRQQADWFAGLLKPYNIDTTKAIETFESSLDSGDHSPTSKLIVSPELKSALKQSIALAERVPVMPVHLLLSVLNVDETTRDLFVSLHVDISEFSKMLTSLPGSPKVSTLTEKASSDETTAEDSEAGPQIQVESIVKHKPTPTLDRYSRDLTRLAEQDQLYSVVGRKREIAATIEILCRQMKRNPILVGEPGVGKTAIAEGLAQHIVEGNVPPQLQGKRLIELSISSLVAGASQVGEFEKRLRTLVGEVKEAGDIILTVELPLEDLNYSEFFDAMGALSFYADQTYSEIEALASDPTAVSSFEQEQDLDWGHA